MENSIGQLAVVTGASSGIGLELAKLFAEHGYDLVVVAEDSGLGAAADQLRSAGAMVESVQADLATQGGVEHLWERVRGLGRPVDAIAINAGIGVGGPFLETDLAKEINMINLNVTGAVHLAKLVVKDMAQRGEGKILITSSIAGAIRGGLWCDEGIPPVVRRSAAQRAQGHAHHRHRAPARPDRHELLPPRRNG